MRQRLRLSGTGRLQRLAQAKFMGQAGLESDSMALPQPAVLESGPHLG